MKIKLIALLTCFALTTAVGQITSRVNIIGKISAPIGDDVEGVVVYNRSSNKGTITDKNGVFKIKAGIGDKLEAVAMQYQNVVIFIDKNVMNNKRLHIFLNESINQLEEVVVTPYDLSGNVKTDIKKVSYVRSGVGNVLEDTSSIINDSDYDFFPDELSSVTNNSIKENRLINGLNFANLFRLVYEIQGKPEKQTHTQDIDSKIRDMYNDQFFKDYLTLEIEEINDFIVFAENNGLDFDYLKSGKELDLLQFLAYQSKRYKSQK